jgi:hypothetical protein
MRSFLSVLVFLGFLQLVGCGKAEPKPVPVKGTVSLDGVPLGDGFMYFKTVETGSLERFGIKDGAFDGKALPGLRRVEIISNVSKKVVIDGASIEVPNNIIHPSFNIESKLTAEVVAEGSNTFNFEVKKK